MRLILKALAALAAVLIFTGLPAIASAERIYFLVGVRHVYRIGPDKYLHADERKQIEQEYADEVSADNAHYQYQVQHGADPDAESRQLQSALHDLAQEREDRLAALYPLADYERERHRGFDITVDGPYQVIGVRYHMRGDVEVDDDYVAYAPWPGYVYVGPEPYGWNYGVVYTPGLFVDVYHGWYGGWVGFGCPAFVGFYGYGGPVVCAGLSINIGFGIGIGGFYGGGYGGGLAFYSNPRLGGFYHAGPGYFAHDAFRGGYLASRRDPRFSAASRAGFAAGSFAIHSARAGGFAQGVRAGAHSSFARGGSANIAPRSSGGSFGRSAAGVRPSGGTFGRSATGARPSGGTFGRSAMGSRPSGGSGYSHGFGGSNSGVRAGSFAHSGGSRGTSSFGRSNMASHSSTSGYAHGFGGARAGSSGTFNRGASRSSGGVSSHSSFGRSAGSNRSFGGSSHSLGGGYRSSFGGAPRMSGGSTRGGFGGAQRMSGGSTRGGFGGTPRGGFGGAPRGGFGGAPRSSGGAPRGGGTRHRGG